MTVAQDINAAVSLIKTGAVGVIPTDTLYGLVAPALNKSAVERVYGLKGRRDDKPCIILIPDVTQLRLFAVVPGVRFDELAKRLWPGAISIVLDVQSDAFAYLHRGSKTLAFRVPADEKLRAFLHATGPLIAPSANPEGKEPARDIESAKAYFGDRVDFYIDGGMRTSEPSTVARYEKGKLVVLRQGAVAIARI